MEFTTVPFALHMLIGAAYLTAAFTHFAKAKDVHILKRISKLNKLDMFVGVCYLSLAFSSPAH